ncbi:MAG TPA: GNAT family N-acetyltransferase, partial [Solirubrobacteraceae bacterium]|nr:GNAT family N-acetyltransferase [Solirubrobacteraceae bacterium]
MLLRGWREDDLVPFAAMGADPEVMEHFPHTLPTTESAEVMALIQSGL